MHQLPCVLVAACLAVAVLTGCGPRNNTAEASLQNRVAIRSPVHPDDAGRPEPPTDNRPGRLVVLSWTQGVPPSRQATDITYYLNGQSKGNGISGFRRIVDELRAMGPEYNVRIIVAWPDVARQTALGQMDARSEDFMPYARFAAERKRLDDVRKQYNMQFEVTMQSAEDLLREQ